MTSLIHMPCLDFVVCGTSLCRLSLVSIDDTSPFDVSQLSIYTGLLILHRSHKAPIADVSLVSRIKL